VWTYAITGTLDFQDGGILNGRAAGAVVPVLLGLYVFGIGKAAVMPFHRWLPAAMVAPTPVSALLHAVAVVKAGVFAVLKVTVYVFGIDFLAGAGAPRANVVDTPAQLLDAFPTILEATGTAPPDEDRALPGTSLFELAGPARFAFIVQAGMPTAVLTLVLAHQFDTDRDLTLSFIVTSTLISPLTLTVLIYLLRHVII